MYTRRLTAGVNVARAVRSARAAAPAVRPTPRAVTQTQRPQTRSLQTSSVRRDLHAQAQDVVTDDAKSGMGSHAAAEKKMQDAEAAASFSGACIVTVRRWVLPTAASPSFGSPANVKLMTRPDDAV